jgi:hypothetical protein
MVFAGSAFGYPACGNYNSFKFNLLLKIFIMQKRFTELSFIIGTFFLIISIILIAGFFISDLLHYENNLFAGIGFFIFGAIMIMITPKK